MPSLSKRTLRELSAYLDGKTAVLAKLGWPAARWLAEIDRALAPKRSVVAARKKKASKDAEAKAEWAEVKLKVFARAKGCCENPGCQRFAALDPDHFLGGNGRRVSLQSVFTVWAICGVCHDMKGGNRPSPAHWLARFIEHCNAQEGRGYVEAREIARARLDSLRIQGRAGSEVA